MIRGNLDRLHLGDLLHWLELGGQTGRLTLSDQVGERRLDFLHGRIVYVSSTVPEERLATWLAHDGLLPPDKVRRLLAAAMLRHQFLTDVLLDERAVSKTDLGASLTVLAELMMNRILDASELRFALDPSHPIPDPSGLYLSLTPSRLLLDSARRKDENNDLGSATSSLGLPLDEESVEGFFWQLVHAGIASDDPVDGDQLTVLHDVIRKVMASLAQWLASSTGLVPQPGDQGEAMAAALKTTGEARLFGLPHAVWNMMVLACSIRSDELSAPRGISGLNRFAASLDLWPEITSAEQLRRASAGALDRLTRRVSVVWARGAEAAAEVIGVEPETAELAAHLLTVPTDLVLWVLATLPVPHHGIRRALLTELPRRIGSGLGQLADFPPELRRLLEGNSLTEVGICLHVSRQFVPSAAAWPVTIPDDETTLFELVPPERLQRAAAAAQEVVEKTASASATAS
jgi:hypothetical protein